MVVIASAGSVGMLLWAVSRSRDDGKKDAAMIAIGLTNLVRKKCSPRACVKPLEGKIKGR